MMNFALKMMKCAFQMMDFAFKMMKRCASRASLSTGQQCGKVVSANRNRNQLYLQNKSFSI